MTQVAAPWRNRIVGTGDEAPDQLLANPRNWRIHPKAQQDALAGVLDQVGWVDQVLVNRQTGHLVDGHLRVELALSRQEPSVPVSYVDLTPDEEALVLASFDPLAGMAGKDEAKLRELLDSITIDSKDLAAMLDELAPKLGGLTDPDEIPEPPDEPTTRPGDLWRLGDHRLICGDAGSVEDLDRLLDGAQVAILATDPPYNVKVEPRSNNAIAAGLSSFTAGKNGVQHHQKFDLERHPEKAQATHRQMRAKDRALVNDFVTDDEFTALLAAWFGNAARVLRPRGAFYIWGGYANVANYPPALKAADLYFSQTIIWDKEHPVLTRKDFMGAHEWCFYGWKQGAAHRFFGPPNVPDLWHVKKVNPIAMVHLTEKPAELARLALDYSSRAGDAVLDPFAGSGSTLIAAEQSSRRHTSWRSTRPTATSWWSAGRRSPGRRRPVGRRGPPKTPTGVKLAQGETRPSRVNFLEPTPRRAMPTMPKDMDDRAKAIWRHVVREMAPTEIIHAADADVLRCYCEAVSQYEATIRMLVASSPLVHDRGHLTKNPLHQVVRDSRDAVRLFARELGLSPSARAGLNVQIDGAGGEMSAEIGLPPRLRVVGGGDAGPR